MKRFLLSLSFFISLSVLTFAQHSIQSTVFDSKNGLPIEIANVRLLRTSDSKFIAGCQTDVRGSFQINKLQPGNYTLVISFLGYIEYRNNIVMNNKDLILKNIHLTEDTKMLGEVEVTGTMAQMSVKGDTLEYNATAFKTAENAVVEDLLKRLPGLEISPEGKITVNGEEIKKIRVDGKKFFGDDVEMATKNIPAELIDKIQVLEQKSDMALLTGFEDNDTERIINLTTKSNRKHGVFGNITGGAGMDMNKDARYDGNSFINIMDNESQTAITAGGNNTNTTRSSRGRSGMGNPSGGITTTQNIGINNNSTVNPNLKIGGDASLNHSANESITESHKESYLSGTPYTNHSFNTSHAENYSANMRLEVEWKPDTINTFVLQPTIGYNRSFSDNSSRYTYMTGVDTTSIGKSNNSGNGKSLDANLNIIYSHKFKSKRGRTVTTNLKSSISQSDNESYNYSDKSTVNGTTTVDQYTKSTPNKYSFNFKISYVEPLWNLTNLLETSITLRSTNSTSEKNQYKKDSTGYYTLKDSTYSNNFSSLFYHETVEMNFRHTEKSYNFMLGIKGDPSQTYSIRMYENGSSIPISNEVFNYSPTARFQYYFAKKKFFRFDYRGETDQPSISDMQPVKNNNNLMNEKVGNPNLKPSYSDNFRIMYSAFNDQTFSSFNVFLNAQTTKDALVSNSIYDQSGKQYNQTVNAGANGSKIAPYNIHGNIMFNTPIIQKKLHFNTSTSAGIDRRYGYSSKNLNSQAINTDSIMPLGDLNNTRTYTATQQLSLTFTSDPIEIGIRGKFRYTNTLNNLNPVMAITKDWTGSGNLVVHLPYSINIGSDLNYTTLQGYSGFDQNQLIWNGSIDKSFFNNKGVISLKLNDILHQQLNIRQTVGDNYIRYTSYNTLTSYFLLNLTYKLNQFKGSKRYEKQKSDMNRFGPGGDRPNRGSGSRGGRFGSKS